MRIKSTFQRAGKPPFERKHESEDVRPRYPYSLGRY